VWPIDDARYLLPRCVFNYCFVRGAVFAAALDRQRGFVSAVLRVRLNLVLVDVDYRFRHVPPLLLLNKDTFDGVSVSRCFVERSL